MAEERKKLTVPDLAARKLKPLNALRARLESRIRAGRLPVTSE
jgi:hypothetical protein